MDWEPVARKKFDSMIALIPFFHRKMANKLAGKKAEENAAARGASMVEEPDIVDAFVSETPKPFKERMFEAATKAGFDMPEAV